MKVEVNILDCPGHIFSGYYGWYRVQAETKLVLKSNHYTLHFASQQLILSFASKKKKKEKRNHKNSVLWHGFSGYSSFSLSYFRTKRAGNPAPAYRR